MVNPDSLTLVDEVDDEVDNAKTSPIISSEHLLQKINEWRISQGFLPYNNAFFALDSDIDYSSIPYRVQSSVLMNNKAADKAIMHLLQGGPSWLNASTHESVDGTLVVIALCAGKPVGAPDPMINASSALPKNPKMVIDD